MSGENISAPAVVTQNLTKVFAMRQSHKGGASLSQVRAVDDLSLEIQRGSLFGLLGVNGAGKTTTVKMLSTLLEPTQGRAFVDGYDTVKDAVNVRSSIGCLLSGDRSHYWKLTARENLRFFGTMYHMEPRSLSPRIDYVLRLMGLSERADERVENYSAGMRQRLGLARAILHDPPVLFLDEPTTGLDVHSARALRQMVVELALEGKAVLLTTHNLQEAQDICTKVAIIHGGRLVALDAPERLRERSQGVDVVEIKCEKVGADFHSPQDPQESPERVITRVAQSAGYGVGSAGQTAGHGPSLVLESSLPDQGKEWNVRLKGVNVASLMADLLACLADGGWRVTGINVKRPDLEDVFVEMTGQREGSGDDVELRQGP